MPENTQGHPSPGLLIALTGATAAERNRVALAITTQGHGGRRFRHVSLADALHREVAAAYGVTTAALLEQEGQAQDRFALRWCRDDRFVRVVAFAHYQQYGLSANEMHELADWPQSPRSIINWWRTLYRARDDRDYWLRHLERAIEASPERNIVISDATQPHALCKVRSLGAKVVLVRSSADTTAKPTDGEYIIDADLGADMLPALAAGLVEVLSLAAVADEAVT